MTVGRAIRIGLGIALTGTAACGTPEPAAETAAAAAPPAITQLDTTPAATPLAVSDSVDRRGLTIYDQQLDSANRMLIKVAQVSGSPKVLRVLIVDRADSTRRWLIDSVSQQYTDDYSMRRVTPSSMVVCHLDGHESETGCTKFFYDLGAKRALNRVDFVRGQELAFASDADAQRILGVSKSELDRLNAQQMFRPKTEPAGSVPALFMTHPLPTTTYAEFARARPRRVEDGYDSTSTLEERVGAWQADSGGFWFGKAFYDSEGSTGVGAIGFLNSSGTYSFLSIPQVVEASVGLLLVEPDVIWASLVHEVEYGAGSGGLLRYDRRTKRAMVIAVPSLIQRIAPIGDAAFVWTNQGLYAHRGGKLVWHHMEPTVDGGSAVVSDTVPK